MSRLVLMTLLLVGCVSDGDEGMLVVNNSAAATDSCSFSGSKDQPFLAHGQIFAGSPTGYLFSPLIESRVVMLEGDTDATQRTIVLTGANVTLSVQATTVQNGNTFTNPSITLTPAQAQFSTLFSASLPPAGTLNVGFELIPVQTLKAIETAAQAGAGSFTTEILASVTILGRLNGKQIDAVPFQFPVSVCNNCVVHDLGPCLGLMASTVRSGNACNPFQDGTVDCCESGANLVCPAVAVAPST